MADRVCVSSWGRSGGIHSPKSWPPALQVLEVGFAIFLLVLLFIFRSVHNRPVLQQLLIFTGITWAIMSPVFFAKPGTIPG